MTKHHEQTMSVQTNFAQEVKSLVDAFEEMGNPFKEDSGDLLTVDTKIIMDSNIHRTVENVFKLGKQQYEQFIKEKFVDRTKPITDPIKKNKLKLFPTKKQSSETEVCGGNHEGRLHIVFQIIYCMPKQGRKS